MLRKRTAELTENGAVLFVVTFLYESGEEKGRTNYSKPVGETQAAQETLTEQEQAILETAINVDYLVCMKELEI